MKVLFQNDLSCAVDDAQEEPSRYGNSAGYRTMWHNLRHDKVINAPCDLTMIAMRELDPNGALITQKKPIETKELQITWS